MIEWITSLFKHPHEKVFKDLSQYLSPDPCRHIVVSYGVIDETEINAKIHNLLTSTQWDLHALNKNAYWTLFARHVTAIRFPANYFSQEDCQLFLGRAQSVMKHILRMKHPSTCALQRLKCIQFGLSLDSIEEPRKFGRLNPRFAYDDTMVVRAFQGFLPHDLLEIQVHHRITAAFFEALILPNKKLEVLRMDFSKMCSQFSKENGFTTDDRISEVVEDCLSRLPRTMRYLTTTCFNDLWVRFLAERFPLLEEMDCSGECAEAILHPIGTLRQMRAISFRTGIHFTEAGFANLGNCSQIFRVIFHEACPQLPLLAKYLPPALTELAANSPRAFQPTMISSLGAFPKLINLTLTGIGSDKLMMQRLAQSNPILQRIDVSKCLLFPEDLDHLGTGFPHLESLVVGDELRTVQSDSRLMDAVNSLKRKRPNLKVKVRYNVVLPPFVEDRDSVPGIVWT